VIVVAKTADSAISGFAMAILVKKKHGQLFF
jgi:hypothetical protein